VQGPASGWTPQFIANLKAAGSERPTLGAYAGPGKLALLRLRPDFDLEGALGDLAPTMRRLDVALLHRLVLERLLGVSAQAVREEKNLTYFRNTAIACESVENGKGQIAFLLNPTRWPPFMTTPSPTARCRRNPRISIQAAFRIDHLLAG